MKLHPKWKVATYEKMPAKVFNMLTKKSMQSLVKEIPLPETAVPFFLRLNFAVEEKATMLFVLGKPRVLWKKHIKEICKAEKILSLAGSCYLEDMGSGNYILCLKPEKGAAKLNIIQKWVKRLYKRYGIVGVKLVEDLVTNEQDNKLQEEDDELPIRKLGRNYKFILERIVTVVKPKIQKNSNEVLAQEDLDLINQALEYTSEFYELYPTLSNLKQKRFGKLAQSIQNYELALEKMKARVEMLIKQASNNNSSDPKKVLLERLKAKTAEIDLLLKQIRAEQSTHNV